MGTREGPAGRGPLTGHFKDYQTSGRTGEAGSGSPSETLSRPPRVPAHLSCSLEDFKSKSVLKNSTSPALITGNTSAGTLQGKKFVNLTAFSPCQTILPSFFQSKIQVPALRGKICVPVIDHFIPNMAREPNLCEFSIYVSNAGQH